MARKHPSDDLMTEMIKVEFQDETGVKRKLTREEILIFVNLIAGAGNETTKRLIGWTGKLLSDHPEQRAELVENPALIPNAIEEILRYESPGPSVARYVQRDVELMAETVPEGSALLLLVASANRDERRYPDAAASTSIDKVRRTSLSDAGFIPAWARRSRESKVASRSHELLKRFPEWTVDMENAKLHRPPRCAAGKACPPSSARTAGRRLDATWHRAHRELASSSAGLGSLGAHDVHTDGPASDDCSDRPGRR